jgi:hypothetical protein
MGNALLAFDLIHNEIPRPALGAFFGLSDNPAELARFVVRCYPCGSEQFVVICIGSSPHDKTGAVGAFDIGCIKAPRRSDDDLVAFHDHKDALLQEGGRVLVSPPS